MLRDLRQSAVFDLSVTRKNLAGGTVYDASKKKNTGTLSGVVTVVPGGFGVLGQAWGTGTAGYISQAKNVLQTNGPLTVVLGFIPNAIASVVLWATGLDSSPFPQTWLLQIDAGGTVSFQSDANSYAHAQSTTVLSTGKPYVIAGTYSGTGTKQRKIYVNGNLEGTITNTADPNYTAANQLTTLGGLWNGSAIAIHSNINAFCAIAFGAELSPGQISSLYNALLTGQPTSIGSPLTRPTRRAAIRRRRLAGTAAAPAGGMPWFIGGGMGSFIG